jgi:hypothetical protein
MSFRNDLDAANARIETLERERRELAEQNECLHARLVAAGLAPALTPLEIAHEPKPWPLTPAWLTSLTDGITSLFRILFSRR